MNELVTVSDDDLIRAMPFVWERMKLVVEPTGVGPGRGDARQGRGGRPTGGRGPLRGQRGPGPALDRPLPDDSPTSPS